MASAAIPEEEKTQADRWRERAMLGDLPSDFLTVALTAEQEQVNSDHIHAMTLQHRRRNPLPKLTIFVNAARLTKNYGFLGFRMDPYVRLTVGQVVYETRPHINGARNPQWNQSVRVSLSHRVESIYLEVYDERNFTQDERIAWSTINIPFETLLKGEAIHDWYPLSGKQGEGQEGMVHVGFQYGSSHAEMATHVPVLLGGPTPIVMYPSVYPGNPYYPAAVPGMVPQGVPRATSDSVPISQAITPPALSAEEIKEFQDIFPGLDEEIIRSVFCSKRGNKEATVNALLELGAT